MATSTRDINGRDRSPTQESLDEFFARYGTKVSSLLSEQDEAPTEAPSRSQERQGAVPLQSLRQSDAVDDIDDDVPAWRAWASRVCMVSCLLLAGFFLFKALPSAPSESKTVATTKSIENIEVFDGVWGRNPLVSEDERARIAEPDPKTWRVLRLRMSKERGGNLWITLARPLEWIEAVGAQQGESFFLDLPEMGALGYAEVLSIGPTPPLKRGEGAVVTGLFEHEAAPETQILRVQFWDGSAISGVTDNHPIWSEDRSAFVPAGELRPGEHVRMQNGSAELNHIAWRSAEPGERLYNLEVHGEHVYQVTSMGVLVHNTCPPGDFQILDGVRRSRAAQLNGRPTIPARIDPGDGTLGPVVDMPIGQLYSPRDVIDVSVQRRLDRWLDTLRRTSQGSVPPPIIVTPGNRGVPIPDVDFQY